MIDVDGSKSHRWMELYSIDKKKLPLSHQSINVIANID